MKFKFRHRSHQSGKKPEELKTNLKPSLIFCCCIAKRWFLSTSRGCVFVTLNNDLLESSNKILLFRLVPRAEQFSTSVGKIHTILPSIPGYRRLHSISSREVWVEVCQGGLQTLCLLKAKIAYFAALFKTRDLILWPWFVLFCVKVVQNISYSAAHNRLGQIRECPSPPPPPPLPMGDWGCVTLLQEDLRKW